MKVGIVFVLFFLYGGRLIKNYWMKSCRLLFILGLVFGWYCDGDRDGLILILFLGVYRLWEGLDRES